MCVSDFSITHWLEKNVDTVPSENESLSFIPQTQLLDDFGLTLFVLDPACQHNTSTERWTNSKILVSSLQLLLVT